MFRSLDPICFSCGQTQQVTVVENSTANLSWVRWHQDLHSWLWKQWPLIKPKKNLDRHWNTNKNIDIGRCGYYIYILNTRIHIHYSTIIFNLYFSWPFSTRKSLDLCGFLLLLLGQATTSAFFKPHQPCFWHPQRASWPWAINPLGKLTHSWNSKKTEVTRASTSKLRWNLDATWLQRCGSWKLWIAINFSSYIHWL